MVDQIELYPDTPTVSAARQGVGELRSRLDIQAPYVGSRCRNERRRADVRWKLLPTDGAGVSTIAAIPCDHVFAAVCMTVLMLEAEPSRGA